MLQLGYTKKPEERHFRGVITLEVWSGCSFLVVPCFWWDYSLAITLIDTCTCVLIVKYYSLLENVSLGDYSGWLIFASIFNVQHEQYAFSGVFVALFASCFIIGYWYLKIRNLCMSSLALLSNNCIILRVLVRYLLLCRCFLDKITFNCLVHWWHRLCSFLCFCSSLV